MLTANNPQKEVNGITNYIWLIQNKTEKKIVEREQMEPSPQKNTKRIMLYLSISIIILNASDFKTSIKRQRLSDWIIKTTMCCLQEMHFKYKNTNRLKETLDVQINDFQHENDNKCLVPIFLGTNDWLTCFGWRSRAWGQRFAFRSLRFAMFNWSEVV